jgi:hypothetical protein
MNINMRGYWVWCVPYNLATPRRAKWAARSSKAKIKRTFIYRNVKYYSLFGLGLTCGTRMVG